MNFCRAYWESSGQDIAIQGNVLLSDCQKCAKINTDVVWLRIFMFVKFRKYRKWHISSLKLKCLDVSQHETGCWQKMPFPKFSFRSWLWWNSKYCNEEMSRVLSRELITDLHILTDLCSRKHGLFKVCFVTVFICFLCS